MQVLVRKSILFVACLGFAGAVTVATPGMLAQSATTGAIGGTVTDSGGALLPNTMVTVKSTETGVTRTVKTGSSGDYKVTELQPGTYSVSYTADGFQTAQQENVVVTVGNLATVSPKLLVGSVSDKVEVSAAAPEVKMTGADISTTIDQSTIDNLPINGRRYSDFALLTPGVVSASDGFGLLSFRGISYLLNNSTVDGADDNQAYFSEARGRTRSAYTVTQGSVQEFQVNTSNYSAEYGRAAGGVINTVTKSGSNEIHGEVYFYDRNNSLGGATNPYTQLYNFNENTGLNVQVVKPKDDRKQYGFGVGGPLIKDKLFWFYAFDQQKRNFPGVARTTDPYDMFARATPLAGNETCTRTGDQYGIWDFGAPTFRYQNGSAYVPGDPNNPTKSGVSVTANLTNPPSVSAPGAAPSQGAYEQYPVGQSYQGNYAACALAATIAPGTGTGSALPYNDAMAYYNQGLGVLSTFFGMVPRFSDLTINFPKMDWQINDRNRISIQYNRVRNDSPNGVQTQTSNFYGRGSYGNDFVKADVPVFRWTSVVTNSLVNTFLAQYGRDMETEFPSHLTPNEVPLAGPLPAGECSAPHNGPCPLGAPDISVGYGYDAAGFDAGTSSLFSRYALPDERRLQLKDDVTFSHGKHTVKWGVDYNIVSDYINNLYNGYGNYDYDWAYSFIGDYLHHASGLGGTAYAGGDAYHIEGGGTCAAITNPPTQFCSQNVGLYSSFSQGFTVPSANGTINNAGASSLITTRDYAGYITDDWRVKPRLTLTVGLRYEYEYIPANPTPNPALNGTLQTTDGLAFLLAKSIPNTYTKPDDRNNLAPRLGAAYDIFGNGKTVVRLGYGIYYGRIINANIEQSYQNSGGPNSQVNISGLFSNYNTGASTVNAGKSIGDDCRLDFPNTFATYARANACAADTSNASSHPSVSYLDPNLRNPYVHEADLDVQQVLGKGWVMTLTYMASFGRKLDSANDINVNLTKAQLVPFQVNNTPIAPPTPAVALPHGSAPPPLKDGTMMVKVYTGARYDASYYRVLEISSNVNTNYNAGAIQVNKKYHNGFAVLANYTLAHALDGNPYIGTGIPSFNILDPNDLSKEYGNSSLDIRQRLVVAATYAPYTHFHGWEDYVLGGWRFAPVVQAQTGYAYTPYISGYPQESASGVRSANGAGGTSGRIDGIERNQYHRPNTVKADIRLSKNFYPNFNHYGLQKLRFEVFAEVFNVMNHQNITGVQTTVYNLNAVNKLDTLTLQPNFGTNTNSNSNYTYTPRQLQLSARIHF